MSLQFLQISELTGCSPTSPRRSAGDGSPRSRPERAKGRTLVAASGVLLVGVLPIGLAIFNDVAWLPPQEMTLQSGEHHVVYILASEGEQTLVLLDESREVQWVNSDTIKNLQPCRLGRLINSQRSIVDMLASHNEPSTPPCPS
jgi:hypothetical protein